MLLLVGFLRLVLQELVLQLVVLFQVLLQLH
jgi:hypothetical protein